MTGKNAATIPTASGTEATILGRFTLSDIGVGLAPAAILVVGIQSVVPAGGSFLGVGSESLIFLGGCIGLFIGSLIVAVTPTYSTSLDWLRSIWAFLSGKRKRDHHQARELSQVRQVDRKLDVIERTDGAFIGMVRVVPVSMALETTEGWERKSAQFTDFLNATVDFPIQIYSTTRSFPIEDCLAHYESRLQDDDVQQNPQLTRLIQQYSDWIASDLRHAPPTIRDHYVVVTVSPSETVFEPDSLGERLARLPIVGPLVATVFGESMVARRGVMASVLEKRLQSVEAGLRDMEGCTASQLSAVEAARVIGRYWSGEDIEGLPLDSALRARAIVGASQ